MNYQLVIKHQQFFCFVFFFFFELLKLKAIVAPTFHKPVGQLNVFRWLHNSHTGEHDPWTVHFQLSSFVVFIDVAAVLHHYNLQEWSENDPKFADL